MVIKKYLHDNQYDYIVYPESSSDFIENIVLMTGVQAIKAYKNDIDVIKNITNSMNLQKMERASHLERIQNMGDTFKINALKATQRNKYEPYLFKPITIPVGKGIIIDDSLFSGTTFRALENVTGIKNWFAIFSK